jgi:vitamin K-dependent gamma-carboxylase-like protein
LAYFQRGRLGFDRLADRLSSDADPTAVAIFRILYGAVSVSFVAHLLAERKLLWLASDHRYTVATVVLVGLIITSAAMTLGLGGRLTRVLHFAVSAFLISLVPFTDIEWALFLIPGLWSCFLETNGALSLDAALARRAAWYPAWLQPARAARWPVFLMGLNIGLLLFSAGLMKHLDPLWRRGDGFYFAFLLPWIKPPLLNPLLSSRILMVTINYVVMVAEYVALPLFIFPRTRRLGVFVMAGFFAGLVFPLRVDPIGEFGLSACVALWSSVAPVRPGPTIVGSRARRTAIFAIAAGAFLLIDFAVLHVTQIRLTWIDGAPYFVRYPLRLVDRSSSVAATTAPLQRPVTNRPKPPIRARAAFWATRLISIINTYTVRLQLTTVFSSADSRGVYLYRTVFTLDDGRSAEPVEVFHSDMTPAEYSDSPLTPRFAQCSTYFVTGAVHEIALKSGPSPQSEQLMRRLIAFSASRLDPDSAAHARTADILVRPILTPTNFQGNVHPWDAAQWMLLFREDLTTGSSSFASHIPPFPLDYPVQNQWVVQLSP